MIKKLNVIAWTCWDSTAHYPEQINRGVAQRVGGLHSALLTIERLDFALIAAMQQSGDRAGVGRIAAQASKRLAASGAETLTSLRTRCTKSRMIPSSRAGCRSSTSPMPLPTGSSPMAVDEKSQYKRSTASS